MSPTKAFINYATCCAYIVIFYLYIWFLFFGKYFDFIGNLFAKLDKLNQASGDYNAKLGVTILGTFLNLVYILSLIYLLLFCIFMEKYEKAKLNY